MNEITCLLLICAVIFLGGIVLNWIVERVKTSRFTDSFKDSFSKTNLPILSLFQGDIKYNFIVDTGSTCNVINSAVLRKLKHSKMQYTGDVVVASGDKTEDNKFVNIAFISSSGETFVEDFVVLNLKDAIKDTEEELGEKIAGIIGNDFLSHYGKQISFKNYTIR